jgi:AcrR family transcriptional regulator
MATARTPRDAWIAAALRALAAGGPDAVRIETLAAGLGVSKGGFYWHFADRGALLAELLDSWERHVTEEVIARVEREGGDARAKLRRLFAMAPSADFEVELALRDWARRDRDVAKRLRGVDSRRMGYLDALFGQLCSDENDVQARTMLAYSLLIGSYFVTAPRAGRDRARLLGLAVERLLGEAWS